MLLTCARDQGGCVVVSEPKSDWASEEGLGETRSVSVKMWVRVSVLRRLMGEGGGGSIELGWSDVLHRRWISSIGWEKSGDATRIQT